jgi:hypothetical protein
VVVLGGKIPLSSTTALITENWFVIPPNPQELVILPAVVFRIAGNRLSWDIGATYPMTVTSTSFSSLGFPIPILTLTYRIN